MSRPPRSDVFSPDEIAIVHVMNRVVRRCFLFGFDEFTGKNYDHRKQWIENELRRVAACFGIDLLVYSILSNHFHLVLRSRPDVVALWSDQEVARRWFTLCPERTHPDGSACTPNESEINSIANDPDTVVEIRSRLSDISWWMRLVSQRIAQRCNAEDDMKGRFWENRFESNRLVDEETLLACAAYVDLNPIRAAMAESLELSDFTSAQKRILSLKELQSPTEIQSPAEIQSIDREGEPAIQHQSPLSADCFLAPLEIDEQHDELGPRASQLGTRCSDKGFLAMPTAAYIELLDWTARQIVPGKSGSTPENAPAIFERLKISPEVWCQMVSNFGQMFSVIAGLPERVDAHRREPRGNRSKLPAKTRELLSV